MAAKLTTVVTAYARRLADHALNSMCDIAGAMMFAIPTA